MFVWGYQKKTAQLSQMKSIVLFLVKQKNQAKEEEEEEEQQYKKKKVSKLQCSIKNECAIRDFEASTFQSDLILIASSFVFPKVKKKLHCSLVAM